MTRKQLAEKCGKSPPFVMTLQKTFGLPGLRKYSAGYAILIRKLIWLQVASVPKKEIQTQLMRERKLLELLKVDSHAPGPTWFEDLCKNKWGSDCLLLSGYSLGHQSGIQTGLDFFERNHELFAPSEMGDDALHAYKLCMETQSAILARLNQEVPVLAEGLKWLRKVRT